MKPYFLLLQINGEYITQLQFDCDNLQVIDKTHFIVNGVPFTFGVPMRPLGAETFIKEVFYEGTTTTVS